MKFICLTIPAYGHVNPILGVMKELVKDKHEVIICNTPEFKDKIIKIGAKFLVPPVTIPNIDLRTSKDALRMAEIIIDMTKIVTDPLIKLLQEEKPDCLFYDSINLWGKIASNQTRIRTIVFSTTMAINPRVILAGTRQLLPDYINLVRHPLRTLNLIKDIRIISKRYQVDSSLFEIFSNENGPNIVFTSRYFQIKEESFGENFKFVGPIIYDRKEYGTPLDVLNTNNPIIYIALGTIYNDNYRIYSDLIKTFANKPYQVIISIGNYIQPSTLGKLPDNIFIESYVPQLEVLKKASLFITHGGMNSLSESLYYGVPMVLLPIIHEQKINASRVEKLGAGVYYKKRTINSAELYNLAINILHTPTYSENAMKISRTLKKAGGYKSAVKYIYDYLQA